MHVNIITVQLIAIASQLKKVQISTSASYYLKYTAIQNKIQVHIGVIVNYSAYHFIMFVALMVKLDFTRH